MIADDYYNANATTNRFPFAKTKFPTALPVVLFKNEVCNSIIFMYCNHGSLHSTSESYIVRCRQYSSYKIAFLSLAILLLEDEYRNLYRHVNRCYAEGSMDIKPTARNIFFAIPSKTFISCSHPLKPCVYMMEETDCEMKSLELIVMFES